MTKITIHEFSTGIRLGEYEDIDKRQTPDNFFSFRFEGSMTESEPESNRPEKIQSLIYNLLFKVSEGKVIPRSEGGSLIAHEAFDHNNKKYYQVLAVATAEKDDGGRKISLYRYFYTESPSSLLEDRRRAMGALVKTVSEMKDEKGNPNYFFQPLVYDDNHKVVFRKAKPIEVEIDGIDITPLPHNQKRSYIQGADTLTDVFRKALYLQEEEQMLGFAYNAAKLQRTENLQIIANINETAQEANNLEEYKDLLYLDFDDAALKKIVIKLREGKSSEATEENKKTIVVWAGYLEKAIVNPPIYEAFKNSHIVMVALDGTPVVAVFKRSLLAYLSNSISKEDFFKIFKAINTNDENYQDFIDGIAIMLKNNPSIFKNQSAELSNLLYTQADSFLKLLEKDKPKKGLFGKKAKDSPIKTSIVDLFNNVKKLEKGTRVVENEGIKTTITEPETPPTPTQSAASTTISPLPSTAKTPTNPTTATKEAITVHEFQANNFSIQRRPDGSWVSQGFYRGSHENKTEEEVPEVIKKSINIWKEKGCSFPNGRGYVCSVLKEGNSYFSVVSVFSA